jgi:hypothetical protein
MQAAVNIKLVRQKTIVIMLAGGVLRWSSSNCCDQASRCEYHEGQVATIVTMQADVNVTGNNYFYHASKCEYYEGQAATVVTMQAGVNITRVM